MTTNKNALSLADALATGDRDTVVTAFLNEYPDGLEAARARDLDAIAATVLPDTTSEETETMTVETWTPTEAASHTRTAVHMLNDHTSHDDDIARENCGACALARQEHSGWLRVYVEAGRTVPVAAFVAELAEAADPADGNPAYFAAILRDIATYGIYVV